MTISHNYMPKCSNNEIAFESRADHSRMCTYLVTMRWSWPWPHDLDTQPWPKCSEAAHVHQKWSL